MARPNWNKTVEEISPRLYRYFAARFSPEDANDLTQETLIRLVRKVESDEYDSRRGDLVMYAFGIAHFVRLEYLKIKSFEAEDLSELSIDTQASALETLDRNQKLRQMVARLPETQQQVLLLWLDSDMTFESIASLLDLSLNTVKSHVHRAKENLKKILGSQQENWI